MEDPVPVEVHLAREDAELGSLERMIADELAKVGQHLWQELAQPVGIALSKRTACPTGGAAMKANRRAVRRRSPAPGPRPDGPPPTLPTRARHDVPGRLAT